MSSWVLLILGALTLAAALNARWPRHSMALVMVSWFGAMLVVELALQLLVLAAVLVGLLVGFGGALSGAAGWAGLALFAAGFLLITPHALAGLRTVVDVDGRPEHLDLARPLAIAKLAQCLVRKLRQFSNAGSCRTVRRGPPRPRQMLEVRS